MSDRTPNVVTHWEERITHDSPPAVRVEHDVRYAAAGTIVDQAEVWCDLGCGSGVAAAGLLDGGSQLTVVLVDVVESVLEDAQRQFQATNVVPLRADLSSEADLEVVRDTLLRTAPHGGCLTCFEVLEHLSNFVPLIGLLVELAEQREFTAVVSTPNDAFSGVDNPYHATTWGEQSFEELLHLLPDEVVTASQVEIRGSGVIRTDVAQATTRSLDIALEHAVPSHYLAAWGPNAHLLGAPIAIIATDRDAQRTWERQRESDLSYYRALALDASEIEITELRPEFSEETT